MKIDLSLEGKKIIFLKNKIVLQQGDNQSMELEFRLGEELEAGKVCLLWRSAGGAEGKSSLQRKDGRFFWRPDFAFTGEPGVGLIQLEVEKENGWLWRSETLEVPILGGVDTVDLPGGGIAVLERYYTKEECDQKLAEKVFENAVYKKGEVDEKISVLKAGNEALGENFKEGQNRIKELEEKADYVKKKVLSMENELLQMKEQMTLQYPFLGEGGNPKADAAAFSSLDSILKSGYYSCKGNLPGAPVKRIGVLLVFAGTEMTIQLYFALSGTSYFRVYSDGVWDDWLSFTAY